MPCTTLCRCFNCCNTVGKRPDPSQKKGQVRKREQHELQSTITGSLAFMQSKDEKPVDPKWTKFEHILVEAIVDMMIEHVGEALDSDVYKMFNDIISIVESAKEINVPISSKSEKSIRNEIANIKKHAILVRQFYIDQVERNLSHD